MANTSSAIKKVRQIERRTIVNRRNKKSMRTQVKKLRKAIEANDAEGAQQLLSSAVSALDRSVQKGVMKKKHRLASEIPPELEGQQPGRCPIAGPLGGNIPNYLTTPGSERMMSVGFRMDEPDCVLLGFRLF